MYGTYRLNLCLPSTPLGLSSNCDNPPSAVMKGLFCGQCNHITQYMDWGGGWGSLLQLVCIHGSSLILGGSFKYQIYMGALKSLDLNHQISKNI